MLRLEHEPGSALNVFAGDRLLLRYVYAPSEPQVESPRPYFHPVNTLGGNTITLYRPHDHVWHKGIAFSLPNVATKAAGTANFWGGPTYRRGRGYEQLPNNGAMRHRELRHLAANDYQVSVAHALDWVTQQGDIWFEEQRRFAVSVDAHAGAWILTFSTELTNISDAEIVFGSPTTEGRHNAGYGGLFWRGPRSFTGGTVYAPGRTGGDELMGVRAPWLGFAGRHDGHGGASTVVFVDHPDNPGHPTEWFVRSEPFACACPAPFFADEVPLGEEGTLRLRYSIAITDGDRDRDGTAGMAHAGVAALRNLEWTDD